MLFTSDSTSLTMSQDPVWRSAGVPMMVPISKRCTTFFFDKVKKVLFIHSGKPCECTIQPLMN